MNLCREKIEGVEVYSPIKVVCVRTYYDTKEAKEAAKLEAKEARKI